MHSIKFWIRKIINTFKEIGADIVFARCALALGATFQRRIPFEEAGARVQEAGVRPRAAAVLAVVEGERVALVAGVMVLVCNVGILRKATIKVIDFFCKM